MEHYRAQFSKIVLDRLHYYATRHIDGATVRNVRSNVALALACDELILTLHASIYGVKNTLVNVCYPATWWDAVKDRFVPKRWRAYVNIRFTTHTIEKHTLFPSVAVPGHEPQVQIMSTQSHFTLGKEAYNDEF